MFPSCTIGTFPSAWVTLADTKRLYLLRLLYCELEKFSDDKVLGKEFILNIETNEEITVAATL